MWLIGVLGFLSLQRTTVQRSAPDLTMNNTWCSTARGYLPLNPDSSY